MIEAKTDRVIEAADRLLASVAIARQEALASNRAIIGHLRVAAGIGVVAVLVFVMVIAA